MDKLFWRDSYRGTLKTYQDLLDDIFLHDSHNSIFIQNNDPYHVFAQLLKNFISGKNSVLLDSDFSEAELEALDITKEIIEKGRYEYSLFGKKSSDLNDVINQLIDNKNNLFVDIYTSGTTGKPKKITQHLANLCRYVIRKKERRNDIWGFAYNPTHFAGLQVFFQAFMNSNTLVYIFGNDYKKNYNEIVENKVTNLSCTPTYMKMMLPYGTESQKELRNITFGGESYEITLEKEIKRIFGKVKIRNIYASTEAGSLLCSDGDSFKIPQRYKKLIRISPNNELMIHKTLLGNSSSLYTEEGWYKTGDLVEFSGDETFKIKNRKSDFINVGGYKVNPKEVEETIMKFENVKDVLVTGKKNSLLGNMVIAKIIQDGNKDEKELKRDLLKFLKKNLQDWKVPRIIQFVDSFELTRTGKIKKA